ncbi:MAG: hypothetical protein WB610_04225 [Rhodomicrobium sp.]
MKPCDEELGRKDLWRDMAAQRCLSSPGVTQTAENALLLLDGRVNAAHDQSCLQPAASSPKNDA